MNTEESRIIDKFFKEVSRTLVISRECIEHAIYSEDGLDGSVGEKALKIINKTIGKIGRKINP